MHPFDSSTWELAVFCEILVDVICGGHSVQERNARVRVSPLSRQRYRRRSFEKARGGAPHSSLNYKPKLGLQNRQSPAVPVLRLGTVLILVLGSGAEWSKRATFRGLLSSFCRELPPPSISWCAGCMSIATAERKHFCRSSTACPQRTPKP